MKFIKLSDTSVEWILEQGKHLVQYGLEGYDGDPAVLDSVTPDSSIYRWVAGTVMFLRSLVGIMKNMPLIEEE